MKKSIFFAILLFYACKPSIDLNYIKSTAWLHVKGYKITEMIDFNGHIGYALKGDTIMLDNKPQAIIIGLDKKNFDLTIQSMDSMKVGHYMDEEETLH